MQFSEIFVAGLFVVGIILLGVLIFIAARKEKKEEPTQMHYRSLFILGICFFPVGVSLWLTLDNAGFLGIAAMGFIYLIAGFAHRNEWMK